MQIDEQKQPATNYYKASLSPIGTLPAREIIEFFLGDGSAAAIAFWRVSHRAAKAKIPPMRISVFRIVNGVPSGIREVGDLLEVDR